jgi:hypothetical protein
MSEPDRSASPFAQLIQEHDDRERCDAEYREQAAERLRVFAEFRAEWDAAWARFLSALDSDNQFQLVNGDHAGIALAGIGAMVNRLGEMRFDYEARPAVERLKTLCEYKNWRYDGPRVGATLLWEAARGATASELAAILQQTNERTSLRTGFGWLEYYRDRLLSPPDRESSLHPGLRETQEAMPRVTANGDDFRFAERALTPWRSVEETLGPKPLAVDGAIPNAVDAAVMVCGHDESPTPSDGSGDSAAQDRLTALTPPGAREPTPAVPAGDSMTPSQGRLFEFREEVERILMGAPAAYRLETLDCDFWQKYGAEETVRSEALKAALSALVDDALIEIGRECLWPSCPMDRSDLAASLNSIVDRLGRAAAVPFPLTTGNHTSINDTRIQHLNASISTAAGLMGSLRTVFRWAERLDGRNQPAEETMTTAARTGLPGSAGEPSTCPVSGLDAVRRRRQRDAEFNEALQKAWKPVQDFRAAFQPVQYHGRPDPADLWDHKSVVLAGWEKTWAAFGVLLNDQPEIASGCDNALADLGSGVRAERDAIQVLRDMVRDVKSGAEGCERVREAVQECDRDRDLYYWVVRQLEALRDRVELHLTVAARRKLVAEFPEQAEEYQVTRALRETEWMVAPAQPSATSEGPEVATEQEPESSAEGVELPPVDPSQTRFVSKFGEYEELAGRLLNKENFPLGRVDNVDTIPAIWATAIGS